MFENSVSALGLRTALRDAMKTALPTSALVGLFVNDIPLTPFTDIVDLVEASFPGYNQVVFGAWTNHPGPGGALDDTNAAIATFTASSAPTLPETAYGIFYVNSAGLMLAAARLEVPKTFSQTSDYLQFQIPKLRMPPTDGMGVITNQEA